MTKTTAAPQNTPATDNRLKIDWSSQTLHKPSYLGVKTIERISIEDVRPYINWRHFYNLWRVQPSSAEAQKIHQEAESLLDKMQHHLQARVGFFSAYATEQSIIIEHPAGCKCCNNIPQQPIIGTPRQAKVNESGIQLSLCDFVAPKGYGDHIGCFAVTVSDAFAKELESLKRNGQEYESLLMQSLGDRLVEAAGEWLHQQVRKSLWGYAPNETLSPQELFAAKFEGIRPAVGYPSLPDQNTIFPLAELLEIDKIGIRLTENGAMYPQASICGLYIASPHARYFIVKE
jgi:5-methyltetrahydrofolate--homocysteine methyltransferase